MPNKRWGRGEGGEVKINGGGRGSKIFLINGGGLGTLKNPLIFVMNEKRDINV